MQVRFLYQTIQSKFPQIDNLLKDMLKLVRLQENQMIRQYYTQYQEKVDKNIKGNIPVCPCCGYEIQRVDININCDPIDLNFIGMGFPMFYKYIKWCIFILAMLFILEGIPMIYMNLNNNFCQFTFENLAWLEKQKIEFSNGKYEYPPCEKSYITRMSIANSINIDTSKLEEDQKYVPKRNEKGDIIRDDFGEKIMREVNFTGKYNTVYAEYSEYLVAIQFLVIVIELAIFRKQQRKLQSDCDEDIISPSDFSILVKNIPLNIKCDYIEKLKEIFSNSQGEVLNPIKYKNEFLKVQNVSLIYDVTDLELLEEAVKDAVNWKQQFLRKIKYEEIGPLSFQNKYEPKLHSKNEIIERIIIKKVGQINEENAFKKKFEELEFTTYQTNKQCLHDIDHYIHEIHEQVEKEEHFLINQNGKQKFTGQAIITYNDEREKRLVLECNTFGHDHMIKRAGYQLGNQVQFPKRYDMINKSMKVVQYEQKENNVFWAGQWLYVEEAPEPTDVDWEFINTTTVDKIKARIKSNSLQILLMLSGFTVIYFMSEFQSLLIDWAFDEIVEAKENKEEKESAYKQLSLAKSMCFVIGFVIVLFNKFALGHLVHKIADMEKWSTKTKLNISFGKKLTIALFFNTALITFGVEVLTFGNYYQTGGMIQSEYSMFILNAIIPPLSWIIDPWSIWQNYKRKKERAKKFSVLTQEQANKLMEHQEYAMGKRYADIMKTMWFTFMYSPAIPIAPLYSMIGLCIYYWADKYNVIKRRHIKEGVGKELSIAMIDLLELILIMHSFGQFWFKFFLFDHQVGYLTVGLLLFSFIYNLFLPVEEINECIFSIDNEDETATYINNYLNFDTDYDRENPVTKQHAIQTWIEARKKQV